MKRSFIVFFITILNFTLVTAQEKLFNKSAILTNKNIIEKLERYKTRPELKKWETATLLSNPDISINNKGIFNIFEMNLQFEITREIEKKQNGAQGFKAILKEGGYAILSNSTKGIRASIWYENRFFGIEPLGEGFYFISETDMELIRQQESNIDYIDMSQNKLKKEQSEKVLKHSSLSAILSSTNVKVFVAYTLPVAQNYDVEYLIDDCEFVTGDAFDNSLVASTIEIVGSQQLTYTESGDAVTDINRFMNNNDGYMDDIHSLRTQYEADICVLLVNSLNARGYAGSIGAGYESAFCVVRADAAVSNYSFPHELAHLYGCRHDSDPGIVPFEYAHGFNWTGKLPYNPLSRKYKTIMSVEDENKYMRVPYFSNPNVVDQLNNPMGTVEDEYCALAIDEYAPILASFETPFTTVGTMLSNENWSGRITVPGELTVASGVTLTIQPGSEIVFVNGAKLLVNGSLDVNGTSSNQAIFDFVSQTSSNGIKIYSSGSADIDYSVIKNANYGVYCNEGELDISNSIIKNCSYGLYLYRTNYASSQPDITNCDIYKTSYDESGTGIYCKYSSPIIINNNVFNYYTGIGTIYNSSPLLEHYTANGNNKLYDNYKNLHAISSSNPFLGTTSYGGYNTLRDYTNKNLIAQTDCNIYAENNYWGSTNSSIIASGISIYSGCSVDYVPFITWDPNGSSKLPDNKLEKSTNSDVVVSNGELSNIQLLILSGKLEEALTESKTLLAESSGEAETLYALDLMWQIERKMKTEKNDSETDLFADIRNKEENDLSQLYVNLIDAVGVDGKSRIFALDNVLQKSGDNETIEKGVIYAKMLYYYNEEIDIDKAKEQYQLLAEKYPNAPITKEALFYLDGTTSNSSQNKLNEEIAAEFNEMPDTYSLFSNYPNPFNPTTTISYSLPRVSNVSLVIYDMMGREVKAFEKTGLSAGVHSFVWDGTNNNGALVTSGIYISKFRAISQNSTSEVYEKTGKLMLLKWLLAANNIKLL